MHSSPTISRSIGPTAISSSSGKLPLLNPCKKLMPHYSSISVQVSGRLHVVIMQGEEQPLRLKAGNIEKDAPQHWGSISKQFTAASVALLVEKGMIDWRDDIRQICPDLPEFKLGGVAQTVTIDDLLYMRSGLSEFLSFALISGANPDLLDNQKVLDLLGTHPALLFAPGSQYVYCNTNYTILAKIVADVARVKNLLRPEEGLCRF